MPHDNWWKQASDQKQMHDDLFAKLMEQYRERPELGERMADMLISGQAPKWFSSRLNDWLIQIVSFPSIPYPAGHWAKRWIAHHLQSDEENDLQKAVKYTSFYGSRGGGVNEFVRIWCDDLAPDSEPKWFRDMMVEYIHKNGDVPYIGYGWAEKRLEAGHEDRLGAALHSFVRNMLNKLRRWSGSSHHNRIDWHQIPSWGREYAKSLLANEDHDA